MANAAAMSAGAAPSSKKGGAHSHAAPPKIVAAAPPRELERYPLVLNNRPLNWITDRIAGVCEKPMPIWWWPAFIVSFGGMMLMAGLVTYLIATGVGVW